MEKLNTNDSVRFVVSRLFIFLLAYSLPLAVTLLALDQPDNREVFSAHGGIGWFLAFICWPWMAVISITNIWKKKGTEFKINLIYSLFIIILYSVITIPISHSFSYEYYERWGLPANNFNLWGAMHFPVSYLYFLISG